MIKIHCAYKGLEDFKLSKKLSKTFWIVQITKSLRRKDNRSLEQSHTSPSLVIPPQAAITGTAWIAMATFASITGTPWATEDLGANLDQNKLKTNKLALIVGI